MVNTEPDVHWPLNNVSQICIPGTKYRLKELGSNRITGTCFVSLREGGSKLD